MQVIDIIFIAFFTPIILMIWRLLIYGTIVVVKDLYEDFKK